MQQFTDTQAAVTVKHHYHHHPIIALYCCCCFVPNADDDDDASLYNVNKFSSSYLNSFSPKSSSSNEEKAQIFVESFIIVRLHLQKL